MRQGVCTSGPPQGKSVHFTGLFCVVQTRVSGRPMRPPPRRSHTWRRQPKPDGWIWKQTIGCGRRRPPLAPRRTVSHPSASVGNERLFLRPPPAAGTSRLATLAPRVPPHSPSLQHGAPGVVLGMPTAGTATRRSRFRLPPPGGQDALPFHAFAVSGVRLPRSDSVLPSSSISANLASGSQIFNQGHCRQY